MIHSLFVLISLVFIFTSAADFEGNLKEFETQIINHPSNHVYLVEFYSPMCGSCEEFKPVWNQLESSVKDIVGTAKVSIDTKHGMKIANNLKILDGGIPAVVLFNESGGKYDALMAGDLATHDKLLDMVKEKTHTLSRGKDGIFQKKLTKEAL